MPTNDPETLYLKAMKRLAEEAERLSAKATPGPWSWNLNLKSKSCHIESHGRGSMREFVMDFVHWGMGGAKPRFLDQVKCLSVDVDKFAKVAPGREHHSDWYQTIDHPDANFMVESRELVPTLAGHVKRLVEEVDGRDATIEGLRRMI